MSQNYNYPCISAEYKGLIQNFIVGFVSGALISSVKNSARNEATQNEKIKDGLKTAIQSGIAASMIAEANHKMAQGHYVDGLFSLTLGATSVYAIEKIGNNLIKKQTAKEVTI